MRFDFSKIDDHLLMMDPEQKEEIYGDDECVLLETIHSDNDSDIQRVLMIGTVGQCEEEVENYNGPNNLTIIRIDEFCEIANHLH
jgi:hypothetical protein